MSEKVVYLPETTFQPSICESCGGKGWCGPTVCEKDPTHEHRVCAWCLSILSKSFNKNRGSWVAKRCPPVVNDSERVMQAMKDLPSL